MGQVGLCMDVNLGEGRGEVLLGKLTCLHLGVEPCMPMDNSIILEHAEYTLFMIYVEF